MELKNMTISTASISHKGENNDLELMLNCFDKIRKNFEFKNKKVIIKCPSKGGMKPDDTRQIQMCFDHLWPGGRGHFEEEERRVPCSIDEFVKHLSRINSPHWQRPERILMSYNFLVKKKNLGCLSFER